MNDFGAAAVRQLRLGQIVVPMALVIAALTARSGPLWWTLTFAVPAAALVVVGLVMQSRWTAWLSFGLVLLLIITDLPTHRAPVLVVMAALVPALTVSFLGEAPAMIATWVAFAVAGLLGLLLQTTIALPAEVLATVGVVVVVAAVITVVTGAGRLRRLLSITDLRYVELQALIRAATEHAIIATDFDGTITFFSAGAERILGKQAASILGKGDITGFFEPQQLARADGSPVPIPSMAAVTQEASQSQSGAATTRWLWRAADGHSFRAKVTCSRLYDGAGEQTGWIFIARDVTADERTQAHLEVAERRWRAVLSQLPRVSVSLLDAGFPRRSATAQTLGRARSDDPSGIDSLLARQPDLAAAVVTEALTAGTVDREVVDEPTGRHLQLSAVPLQQDAQSPEVILVTSDITEQRRREQELLSAKNYAERLFVEAPHGKFLLDPGAVIVKVNPALATMIGTAPDLLMGVRLAETAMAGFIPAEVITSLAGGRAARYSNDTFVELEQGSTLHVSVHAVALDDDTGTGSSILVSVVDISERRKFEQQLAHLADHDPLTGLFNRRRFDEELASHLQRCQRYGAQGSVLMIDLDHFKNINDTLGHSAGDQLIISLASVLRQRLRTSDVVARLGGDEFAVLLPMTDREATIAVANDLVALIRSTVCVLDGTRPRRITASIGAVLITEADTAATEVLSAADMTMYDAKEAGRDRFVIHDAHEHPLPRTGARIAWVSRIEAALEERAFVVHAQPILNIRTGRLSGAELLIRMVGANGDLIMPGRFLYIAERTSLITSIDAYMIEEAVRLLDQIKLIDPHFQISVNLSGRSVGSPVILELIPRLLAQFDIDPGNLILEITETSAVSSIEQAREFAKSMQDLGCRFALDDFGAGFGSFYYLKHLRFDYIKIDGEFVSNVADTPSDQLIISSIVDIAHGMGKATVAEFVKDERTLEAVRALGVDKAQGYSISKPMPCQDLLRRLSTNTARFEPADAARS